MCGIIVFGPVITTIMAVNPNNDIIYAANEYLNTVSTTVEKDFPNLIGKSEYRW